MHSAFRLGVIIFTFFCLTANALGTWILFDMNDFGKPGLVLYGASSGFVFGQVTLLVIWGVLGPEPLSRQLPRSIGLCIFVFYSWIAGTVLANDPPPTDVSFFLAIFAAFMFLILTTPMWIVRRLLSWRIYTLDQRERGSDQFTIRHIMIWTAAIAVLTAIGRVLFTTSNDGTGMPPASTIWTSGFMILGISAFIAGLGLPLVWGVLSPRMSHTAWWAIFAVFTVGPMALHECLYLVQGQSPNADDRFFGILSWYGFYILMSLVVCSALWVVRIHGYRFGNPTPEKESRPI
jgi:hypothetical protein